MGDAGANRGHAGEQARGQSRGHRGHCGCTTQHRSTKHSTPWTRTACAERKGPDTLCDPKFIQVLSSRYVTSDSLRPHGLQHARPPCPSPTPSACSNPCPWSRGCHPTISPSVVPFSSRPQSFPASGSFPVSQLFASGGQKFWSFSFSISPSSEYSGLISFRLDWCDLLAVLARLIHPQPPQCQAWDRIRSRTPQAPELQLEGHLLCQPDCVCV